VTQEKKSKGGNRWGGDGVLAGVPRALEIVQSAGGAARRGGEAVLKKGGGTMNDVFSLKTGSCRELKRGEHKESKKRWLTRSSGGGGVGC